MRLMQYWRRFDLDLRDDSPGRTHYEGGGPPSGVEWDLGARGADPADELTPGRLTARREWLGQTVSKIAADALAFAQANFPPVDEGRLRSHDHAERGHTSRLRASSLLSASRR
jgi:hypothetical protein